MESKQLMSIAPEREQESISSFGEMGGLTERELETLARAYARVALERGLRERFAARSRSPLRRFYKTLGQAVRIASGAKHRV